MTVKQLRNNLAKFKDDEEVFISTDEEINYINTIRSIIKYEMDEGKEILLIVTEYFKDGY